jgi:hypothetical protein
MSILPHETWADPFTAVGFNGDFFFLGLDLGQWAFAAIRLPIQ